MTQPSAPPEPVKIASKPPRSGPPKKISGSLTLTPEILEMKKQQEEAKKRADRILHMVTTNPPPVPSSAQPPKK